MLKIKKKDKVKIRTGKYKGKISEVVKVFPKKKSVIVSKVNLIKRHTRPTQTEPGGIIQKEAPISIANVQLVCPKCNQPTRVRFDRLSDGKKIRVCKKCNEMII